MQAAAGWRAVQARCWRRALAGCARGEEDALPRYRQRHEHRIRPSLPQAEKAPDIAIIELANSTATVALAAEGHGVEPAQIAKTLSLRVGGQSLLVVTRGDARLDNRKAKAAFGGKVSMLGPEEVVAITGHPVGGVCPFGLATPLPVYCDVSLQGVRRGGAGRRLDP